MKKILQRMRDYLQKNSQIHAMVSRDVYICLNHAAKYLGPAPSSFLCNRKTSVKEWNIILDRVSRRLEIHSLLLHQLATGKDDVDELETSGAGRRFISGFLVKYYLLEKC